MNIKQLLSTTLILSAGVFLSACTTETGSPDQSKDHAEKADVTMNIAAYHFLINHFVANQHDDIKAYCLIDGGDEAPAAPSRSDMEAVARLTQKRVIPEGKCSISHADEGSFVLTNDSHERALILWIGNAHCHASDDCSFNGGYGSGESNAFSARFKSRKIDGRWIVTPVGPSSREEIE